MSRNARYHKKVSSEQREQGRSDALRFPADARDAAPGDSATRPGGRPLALWLFLAAPYLLLAAKACLDLTWLTADPLKAYADSAVPMLTSYDAYAFLAQVERLLGTLPDAPGAPVTPLALLLAGISTLTGLPLRAVALVACTLLAASLIPVVQGAGRRLWGETAGAVAGLAAAACPYFQDVTALGRCDTDCLIPGLLLASGMALGELVRTPRPAPAVRAALLAGLTAWWWRPGGYLAGLMAVCAALIPVRRPGRTELAWRLGVAGLGLALGLVLAGGVYERFPKPLAEPFRYAERHLGLALKADPAQASVARSIIELRPVSPSDLGRLAMGSLPALLLGIAGLAAALWRNPWAVGPLLPLAAAGYLALDSMRMVLLFFPLAALGLGVAIQAAVSGGPLSRLLPGPTARAWAALLLVVVLTLPALDQAWRARPAFSLDRRSDALALAARQETPEKCPIWTWWDYGYFFQARAARPTFFDGGSQTVGDCFVAAFPLVCPDPDLAANWMRFFAARGQGEFDRLAARAGSRRKALELLTRLFSGREDRKPLMAALDGGETADPAAHFFPDRDVCLILPRNFLILNGYWMAYGSSPAPPSGPPANQIDPLPADGLAVDAAGRVTLPRAATAKGYGDVPTALDLAAGPLAPAALDALAEPILLFTPGHDVAYIATRAGAKSLAFRLLAPTGFTHPRFTPLRRDPEGGGVWLVR